MRTYCHLCGTKYTEGQSQPWKCNNCSSVLYENPSPTVDLLLFNDKQEVLVATRAKEPNKGLIDFPGGFVELGESLDEAVIREISEETGLRSVDFTEPTYVTSLSHEYLFGGISKTLTPALFTAKLLTDKELTPNDDVESLAFVAIDDLDSVNFTLPEYPAIARKAHAILFG